MAALAAASGTRLESHQAAAPAASSSPPSVEHRIATVSSSSVSSSPSLSTTIPPNVHRHAVTAAASSSSSSSSSLSALEQLREKIVREKKATWQELQRLYGSTERFFAEPAERVVEHLDLTEFQGNGNDWDRMLQRVVRFFPAVHSIDIDGPHFTDAHLRMLCQGLVTEVSRHSRLKCLHLDSCPSITTLSPIVNHDCAYIEELLIRNCPQLTIAQFREISGVFHNLRSLTLRLAIDLSPIIRILGQHLTYLDLSGCSLTDGHIHAIGGTCSGLETLILHSDEPTRSFSVNYTLRNIGQRIPKLKYLSINWFRIGGESAIFFIRQSFFHLRALAVGYCPENRFAQEVLRAFSRVPFLDLSRCSELTDAALPETCQHQFIDFSGCRYMTPEAITRLVARSPSLQGVKFPDGTTRRSPAAAPAAASSSSSSSTTPATPHAAAAAAAASSSSSSSSLTIPIQHLTIAAPAAVPSSSSTSSSSTTTSSSSSSSAASNSLGPVLGPVQRILGVPPILEPCFLDGTPFTHAAALSSSSSSSSSASSSLGLPPLHPVRNRSNEPAAAAASSSSSSTHAPRPLMPRENRGMKRPFESP